MELPEGWVRVDILALLKELHKYVKDKGCLIEIGQPLVF